MIRRVGTVALGVFTVLVVVACLKKDAGQRMVVEIPSGFTGNFVLEMGVKDAPALDKMGSEYFVVVPKDGKLATSTLLSNPQVSFRNASDGSVWGYSHRMVSTGDGIPVGGRIEFFVGTKKDFDAEEQRKNHSGRFGSPAELSSTGV